MKATLLRRGLPVLVLLGLSAVGLAGCRAMASLGLIDGGPGSSLEPTASAVPPGSSIIAGRVWLDQCLVGVGCVRGRDGLMPDGIEDSTEPGLSDVVLLLGAGQCPSEGLRETRSGANGTYLFTDLEPGTYCVSIDPQGANAAALNGTTEWTHPSSGPGVSRITITIQKPDETRLVNFGRAAALAPATPTTVPPPEELPTPTPTSTSAPAACTDWAEYVKDVTIPDNTRIEDDERFDKTWRLRNIGSCTWTQQYELVFVSGNRLRGPETQPLPRRVPPGDTIDLTVRLRSPEDDGFYRGYWMLRNDSNRLFGAGSKANSPIWVQIVVGPLGTTTSGSWRGEYFARRDLKGTAGFVRNDPVIDFNWKEGSPGAPLASNDFSVRWTGSAQFDRGTYRFRVGMDDGARLWVDDKLVIDSWRNGSWREATAEIGLTKGSHKIRLEYFERSGDARVRLSWNKVSSPSFSHWKGEYWDNRRLDGSPDLTRDDPEIDFNWKDGSPAAGLPSDDFSARWTRTVDFQSGLYRFTARSDDGLRVYVGDQLILDEWHDSSADEIYTVDVNLSGSRTVRVEYYERRGRARVELHWQRLEPTATPSASASPTPTSTASPTATATATPTATGTTAAPPTETPTATATPSPSASPTETATATATASPTSLAAAGNRCRPVGPPCAG